MGKKSKRRYRNQRAQRPNQLAAQPVPAQPPETPSRRPLDRTEIERYMEQFTFSTRLYKDLWHQERVESFITLYEYCCFQFQEHFGTDADLEFLRKIRKNESEPVLFRAIAFSLTSWVIFVRGFDTGEAKVLKYSDKAAALCDAVDDGENKRSLDLFFLRSLNLNYDSNTPVSKYLSRVRSGCRFFEDIFDPSKIVPHIPGLDCGYCRTPRSELGPNNVLRACKRCKMEFYCSDECHKMAWLNRGHKYLCRKPGEFKEGDTVYLCQPGENTGRDRVELVSKCSMLNGPMNDNMLSLWTFKTLDEFPTTGVIPASQLKRCPPRIWRAAKRNDGEWYKIIGFQDENGIIHRDVIPGLVSDDD